MNSSPETLSSSSSDGVAPANYVPTTSVIRADLLESTTPSMLDTERRIVMALQCHDADSMTRVPNAGTLATEPHGTVTQLMHNGLKVVAGGYYGEWMTQLIELCRGHHEPQEELLFQEVLRCTSPQATMIELGGYWSYYSLWFLQGAPLRRAVVVEPDPAHMAVGQRNAALNNLTPIFRHGFAGAVSQQSQSFQTEESGIMSLPCLTVLQLMQEHGIEYLDVLHLDIQGAELDVLTSCTDLFLSGRVGWVFVSTHAFQISGDPLTHQRCLAILQECGAKIEADHEVHESYSGDGLIVARFQAAPAEWRGPVNISYNRYSKSLFRNPLYDLSETLRNIPDLSQYDRYVAGIYRTLLLRDPDPAGLRVFADQLRQTGDLENVIGQFLRSEEFAQVRPNFVRHYDVKCSDTSAVICSGLRLVLRENGTLGSRGDTLLVPIDKIILPAVQATASWQPESIDFALSKLSQHCEYTLLDIGANIGLFSRQFLNAFPATQRCVCVEPEPGNFEALTYNLHRYGTKVELFNQAVGAHEGEAEFFCDVENSGNYSLNKDAMRDRPFWKTRVQVVSANKWLSTVVLGSRNIVWKTDTQGFDEIIITNTPEEVWSQVSFAIVELWRIFKPVFDRDLLARRFDCFPNKSIGLGKSVTTGEVMNYITGTDWAHEDLYLWR